MPDSRHGFGGVVAVMRWLRSPWPYFALSAALVAAVLAARVELRRDRRPTGSVEEIESLRARQHLNLLLIVVDTLRADRLGSYGYERPTSPAIDAVAAEGVRFARVLAQSSWTKCSMASLWTALYPVGTGVLRFPHALPPEARLPAEILREAGFRTAGIWRNGWVGPQFGFGQGFELYQRPQPGLRPDAAARHNPSAHPLAGSDADLTSSAIEFLRSSGHERFFLYLHYMDVHQYAHDEASALFGTRYSDLYDNAIHWVDRNIAALLRELDAMGLREETLIAIAADHGEAFGEHGREGHARDLYREVTETPFVLGLPFRLTPGIVVEEPVENVDLWPTLLDLLGLPGLEGAHGRSLVPLLSAAARGEPRASGRPRFAHIDRSWGRRGGAYQPLVAVTQGDYRLIDPVGGPSGPELYARASDPAEQADLAADRPETVEALRERVEAYLRLPPASWGRPREIEIDESELVQLRALGYAVEDDE